MKHATPSLLFGATAAAVAYASGAPVWGTAVAGVLVTVGVWALAYALGRH
jgi:VIT1/CCC1 family predicted Fe2+/Mn2+ transporter